MNDKVQKILENACAEGKQYLEQFSSIKDAWNNCERGDWMMWLAQKLGVPVKELILAKGLIAQTAIHLTKNDTSKKAVVVAIAFGKGRATLRELDTARIRAYDCLESYGSNSSILARHAAFSSCGGSSNVVATANAMRYSEGGNNDSAYTESLKNSADICRQVLTKEVFKRLKDWKKIWKELAEPAPFFFWQKYSFMVIYC